MDDDIRGLLGNTPMKKVGGVKGTPLKGKPERVASSCDEGDEEEVKATTTTVLHPTPLKGIPERVLATTSEVEEEEEEEEEKVRR